MAGERWWRAYESSIDHPKLLKLSDSMHRGWYTLQCIASANNGRLPSTADIALRLRIKPAKVAEWITHLSAAGLIDRDGDAYHPHNWDKRQYKVEKKDPAVVGNSQNSYVYVIGPDWSGIVKIGFSKNPWARLADIQTSHHEKMSVLASFRCKAHSEVAIHDLLKTYRRQGEWFELPPEIIKSMQEVADRRSNYEILVAEITTLLRSTTTETEQIQSQTTEQKMKDAAPDGSHLVLVSPDLESQFFRRSQEVLGNRGLGAKLLQAKQKNLSLARAALETAATKDDPREYVGRIISGKGSEVEDLRARGEAW